MTQRQPEPWRSTVLDWDEFYLLAKVHDYDFKFACEAQAKKSYEVGYNKALSELGYTYQECKTCSGTGEIPVPIGDYPLSDRMRPCPDCDKK